MYVHIPWHVHERQLQGFKDRPMFQYRLGILDIDDFKYMLPLIAFRLSGFYQLDKLIRCHHNSSIFIIFKFG